MTFDDEFQKFVSSVDGGTGWMTRLPYSGQAARNLYPNHELEYYSDSSVGVNPFTIVNGALSITASRAPAGSNPYKLPYDSGIITTKHSLGQLYGYFEVRAELPKGNGLWPAFWLKPVDGTALAELDAFEVLGNDPTKVYLTTHDRASGHDVTQERRVNAPDTSAAFHTYGVDWEPTTITFSMDGVVIGTMATPASMNKPMYMLLDLAVGGAGSWPGAPTSSAEFPAAFRIDYVRAYATASTRNVTGTAAINTPAPTPPPTPAPTPAPAPAPIAIAVTGNGAKVVRGDGAYSVTGAAVNATVTLGNGTNSVALTGDNNTVALGDGNKTVSLTGVGETVALGTGTSSVRTTGGEASISADGGAVTIVAGGVYNDIALTNGQGTVTAGSGRANVGIDGHVSTTNAVGGTFTVNLAGKYNTVTALAHSLVIRGSSGSSTFNLADDAAAERINAGAGGAARSYSVSASGLYNRFDLYDSVQNTIVAGQGGAAVTISDAADELGAAAGAYGLAPTTISFGGINNALVDTGLGDLTVTGGSGQGTFILGDGDDTLTTGGAYNRVVAGAGRDTINSGGDHATITLNATNVAATVAGSGNRVTFNAGAHGSVFDNGQGLHVLVAQGAGAIDLKNIARDSGFVIDLLGGIGGYATAADAAAAISSDGAGGSVLSLGGGSLHFEGLSAVTAGSLRID